MGHQPVIKVASTLWLLLGAPMARAQQCEPRWNSPGVPSAAVVNSLYDVVAFDFGQGHQLVAGGWFGYPAADPIRRWDGVGWQPIGSTAGSANTLLVADDGTGLHLYAIVQIDPPNGTDVLRMWTGQSWVDMPSTMFPIGIPRISADLGQGMQMFGQVARVGTSADTVARWNGTTWVDVGRANGYPNERMAVFNDGTGPALAVFGGFTSIAGVPANHIAMYKHGVWSAMGSGWPDHFDALDLCAFNDGTGERLYIAGNNALPSALPSPWGGCVLQWTGSDWVSVGGGIGGPPSASSFQARRMAVMDDGSGPALYVVGQFSLAGGVPARNIAKWDGHQWSALGSGMSALVRNVAVADDGRGPSLFISGFWAGTVGAGVSPNIAQWIACPRCYANSDNSTAAPKLNVNDFINFLNMYARRNPYADCDGNNLIGISDFSCFMNKFAVGCP